jgi:hypothetical protein
MQQSILEEFLGCRNKKQREAFLLKHHHGYWAARNTPLSIDSPVTLKLFAILCPDGPPKGACSHAQALRKLEKGLHSGSQKPRFPQIPHIEKGLQTAGCFQQAQKYVRGFLELLEREDKSTALATLAERLNKEMLPHLTRKIKAGGTCFYEIESKQIDIFCGEHIILSCLYEIWAERCPHGITSLPVDVSRDDTLKSIMHERRASGLRNPSWRFPQKGAKDPLRKAEALSLVNNGSSDAKAAAKVGVHRSTVGRWKKEKEQIA